MKMLLSAFGCLCLIVVAGAAGAYEVIWEDDAFGFGTATEIRGLVVDSNTYDVVFLWATADSVYNTTPPGEFDFSTEQDATDAMDAVLDALNSVLQLERVGPLANNDTEFLIPYVMVTDTSVETRRGWDNDPPWEQSPASPTVDITDLKVWADFDAVVPVEGSTWGKIKALYR